MTMKREIRPFGDHKDFVKFARISQNAYPGGMSDLEKTIERMKQIAEADQAAKFYGIFAGGDMLGGMLLIDFQMNYFGQFIPAGGVGWVAVDLTQRRLGAAKELVEFFLDSCEAQGQFIAMLYPFRPDFYRQMGFGHGLKMHQYSFKPTSLPRAVNKGDIVYLELEDLPLLKGFFSDYAATQHGYCLKGQFQLEEMLKRNTARQRVVGFIRGGHLKGYLVYSFRKGHESNFLKNDLLINEWLWQGHEALEGFAGFLNSLADQVDRVVFNTQQPDFHLILEDPRNASGALIPSVYHESYRTGVGLMYRVVSLERLVQSTSYRVFGGRDVDLTISLADSFRPGNAGTYHVSFRDGRATLSAKGSKRNVTTAAAVAVAEISLDVAEFSSLWMGAVDFRTLYQLGLLEADEASVNLLSDLFAVKQKPQCIAHF